MRDIHRASACPSERFLTTRGPSAGEGNPSSKPHPVLRLRVEPLTGSSSSSFNSHYLLTAEQALLRHVVNEMSLSSPPICLGVRGSKSRSKVFIIRVAELQNTSISTATQTPA